jgi:hypothetical protein
MQSLLKFWSAYTLGIWFWNQKVNYDGHQGMVLVPIDSHAHPAHAIPSCFFKINFILPSMPSLPSGLSASCFPQNPCMYFSQP